MSEPGPTLNGGGFSGETLIHCRDGIREISTLIGRNAVHTLDGRYLEAEIRERGIQPLDRVQLESQTFVYATDKRLWPAEDDEGRVEWVETGDLEGKRLRLHPLEKPPRDEDFDLGAPHGIFFGVDATHRRRDGDLEVWGERTCVVPFVKPEYCRHLRASSDLPERVEIRRPAGRLRRRWAAPPSESASPSYWRGFIDGYISTAGLLYREQSAYPDPVVAVHHDSAEVLLYIADQMARCGFVSAGIREIDRALLEIGPGSTHQLLIHGLTIDASDLLLPSTHSWLEERQAPSRAARVVHVDPAYRIEQVFDCTEPQTGTVVIVDGYVAGARPATKPT